MISTVDKVRRLEQYLALGGSAVDSVLEQSIDKLLDRERERLLEVEARPADDLSQLEDTYSLASSEFYRRYEAGEMGDAMDFVEWASTWEMLMSVRERLAVLEAEAAP